MLNENEPFMNTLVVAIYGGDPSWYPADLQANNPDINEEYISEDALNTLGFLKLTGKEKLFALDGQHRLAGLKKLIDDDFSSQDEISVIFVGHDNTNSGIERTRRLFTTLNKKAVPVSKGEIIALDENDLMAIVSRKLIENSKKFGNKRIAIKTTNNLSTNDKVSLTTQGNLYDLLGIVFSKIYKKGKPIELKNFRKINVEIVEDYYQIALDFFDKLESTFSELDDFFNLVNFQSVVEKNRNETGGNILFRPVGLTIVFELIQFLVVYDKVKIYDAFDRIKDIPLELSEHPIKILYGLVAVTICFLEVGLRFETNYYYL